MFTMHCRGKVTTNIKWCTIKFLIFMSRRLLNLSRQHINQPPICPITTDQTSASAVHNLTLIIQQTGVHFLLALSSWLTTYFFWRLSTSLLLDFPIQTGSTYALAVRKLTLIIQQTIHFLFTFTSW